MRQHLLWHRGPAAAFAVALFILTVACAGSSAATPPTTPQRLGTFQHRLPSGENANIRLWHNPDGSFEAKLERSGGEDLPIGTFQQHFPDMPGETVLFHLEGSDYIILGTIDETITGELSTVDFEPAGATNINWLESLKVTRPSRSNPPIFAVIIRADEIDRWQGVQRIAIKTRESLNQLVEDPSTTGAAWEKKYDPPVDISSLFIDIQP
ncbi:hypothetical protein F8S13_04650 [Chloroflexia bacterium SDU3-3]|nr:hypothetical protein F8S13_04650 [Chloroflexia bacterium SDU3-3]